MIHFCFSSDSILSDTVSIKRFIDKSDLTIGRSIAMISSENGYKLDVHTIMTTSEQLMCQPSKADLLSGYDNIVIFNLFIDASYTIQVLSKIYECSSGHTPNIILVYDCGYGDNLKEILSVLSWCGYEELRSDQCSVYMNLRGIDTPYTYIRLCRWLEYDCDDTYSINGISDYKHIEYYCKKERSIEL